MTDSLLEVLWCAFCDFAGVSVYANLKYAHVISLSESYLHEFTLIAYLLYIYICIYLQPALPICMEGCNGKDPPRYA